MIPLTNYDFQWGRSEVVIIYPDILHPFPKNVYGRFLPPRDLSMVWRQKCLGLRPVEEIAPEMRRMKRHISCDLLVI